MQAYPYTLYAPIVHLHRMLSGDGGSLRKFHDQAIRPRRSRDIRNDAFTQCEFNLDQVRGPVNSHELNFSGVLTKGPSAQGKHSGQKQS
jgi:hypothetical protein